MTTPRPLPEVFADAERLPAEVAALLHKARALRLELEAAQAPTGAEDGQRVIHGITVARIEASLIRTLEDVVAALAQVRGLQRGLDEEWLRNQLEGLT